MLIRAWIIKTINKAIEDSDWITKKWIQFKIKKNIKWNKGLSIENKRIWEITKFRNVKIKIWGAENWFNWEVNWKKS